MVFVAPAVYPAVCDSVRMEARLLVWRVMRHDQIADAHFCVLSSGAVLVMRFAIVRHDVFGESESDIAFGTRQASTIEHTSSIGTSRLYYIPKTPPIDDSGEFGKDGERSPCAL